MAEYIVNQVWGSGTGPFAVVQTVLDDDEDNVLYHTLYRQLVLFTLDDDLTLEPSAPSNYQEKIRASPVWHVLCECLTDQKKAGAYLLQHMLPMF